MQFIVIQELPCVTPILRSKQHGSRWQDGMLLAGTPTFGAEAEQVDPRQPPARRVRQQRDRAAVRLPPAVVYRLPHVLQVPAP